LSRQLSQSEIDAVFQNIQERKRESPAGEIRFRRPDRIPKSQVRAIHLLHDTFVRNLVSSLSAYLRSYLTVNLVSVEQLSYAEFLDGLPSPTCIVSLGSEPLRWKRGDGTESLAGIPDSGDAARRQREIVGVDSTRYHGNRAKTAGRIVPHHPARFAGSLESGSPPSTSPSNRWKRSHSLVHILAPNEAVVSIGIEIRIGDTVGMMNIAMPSIVIKMMRQKFDHQWSVRKTHANEAEQARILRVLRGGHDHARSSDGRPHRLGADLLSLRQGYLLISTTRWSGPWKCWPTARINSPPS